MDEIRNIVRAVMAESVADELKSKWGVGGYYAIEGRPSSSGVKVDLYDSKGRNVGEIYGDGRFYYNDGSKKDEPHYGSWRVKSEFSFDPESEEDIRNALRLVYLSHSQRKLNESAEEFKILRFPDIDNWYAKKFFDDIIGIFTEKGSRIGTLMKGKNKYAFGYLMYEYDPETGTWKESEDRDFNDVKNAVRRLYLLNVSRKLRLHTGLMREMEGDETIFKNIGGYSVKEMKKGYMDDEGIHRTYWNIYDEKHNDVAFIDEFGNLSYEAKKGDVAFRDSDMKFDPYDKKSLENAVRYVFLLRSGGAKKRGGVNENAEQDFNEEHKNEEFIIKFPELDGMFVTKEIIDRRYGKLNTWFFYDGEGNFAATLSEPRFLTYHDKHGNPRSGEVFFEESGLPDFKKMATLIWLDRQKPVHESNISKPKGPFRFKDVAGYSASGPYEDTEGGEDYWGITDERGIEVGMLNINDGMLERRHPFYGWIIDSGPYEINEEGIKQAARFLYLKTNEEKLQPPDYLDEK